MPNLSIDCREAYMTKLADMGSGKGEMPYCIALFRVVLRQGKKCALQNTPDSRLREVIGTGKVIFAHGQISIPGGG